MDEREEGRGRRAGRGEGETRVTKEEVRGRRRRVKREKTSDLCINQDDFYLNLVDWSSQNLLAVGLGNSVYLWNAGTSQVTKLCELVNDSVTSVSWIQRVCLLLISSLFYLSSFQRISHEREVGMREGRRRYKLTCIMIGYTFGSGIESRDGADLGCE